MLFSEPKIPQSSRPTRCWRRWTSFSALQRAENSSIDHRRATDNQARRVSVLFSEPKIPQLSAGGVMLYPHRGFSALQRAENSSTASADRRAEVPQYVSVLFSEPKIPQLLACPPAPRARVFQCSSASRKFLNQFGVLPRR